ncbi:4Fe-4S dicluster domain-containing protein [Candidatus Hecatella orcuttiae]|jgi:ferredoxin-like protein FixX|uniref:4Fe-4S dicluster domain-containing protein n=1 Tax=Candidatus Hecatella orcuttiae TaxID=1935119 RepID=UPI0028681F1B|nr:4Fe-4S dicluster domain-containing protein [Candidatus Hecatella orcuttiae]
MENQPTERSWAKLTRRQPKTKVHVEVLEGKCTGCGLCVKLCPSGSWVLSEGTARWMHGMERCFECGTCYHLCQTEAIKWRYPRGGEGVVYE